MQYPCDTEVVLFSDDAVEAYIWVYEEGETEGAGAAGFMSVEIGTGDEGSDPSSDESWSWRLASYNLDVDGLFEGDLANDEYMGELPVPTEGGTYNYAARVTRDGGSTYEYCDLGVETCDGLGSTDGYDAATAGVLTVVE